MAVNTRNSIVTDGLILYLDAANRQSYPGGGTTWRDLSGGGNNGTLLNGPTFDSSNNGGSIVFDGVNDYGQIPDNNILNPSLSMTLSVWININTFVISMSMIGKSAGSSGYDFRIDTPNSLNLVKYAVIDQNTSIPTLFTNTWYNIVAVQGSTRVDYYINGLNVGFFLNSAAYISNTLAVRIARDKSFRHTPAKISQILFYNRALSPQEILQNYNATKSRFNLL